MNCRQKKRIISTIQNWKTASFRLDPPSLVSMQGNSSFIYLSNFDLNSFLFLFFVLCHGHLHRRSYSMPAPLSTHTLDSASPIAPDCRLTPSVTKKRTKYERCRMSHVDGRCIYFSCLQSLGAAHWVAQCWKWKTVKAKKKRQILVLFSQRKCKFCYLLPCRGE